MDRDHRPSKSVEWIMVGFMAIGSISVLAAVTIFALSGNPIFVFLLWSLLGGSVSLALQILVRRLTNSRRSYWMLMSPLCFAVLLSAVFLFFYSRELVLESFGALGFYATFFTSLGTAKNIFSPRGSEKNF